ncbi:MAG TPA: DUF1802 family protein [Pirellulales bacterium]|jgi:hypothetical protein|nr:DUF1802 family protein [Pirellulales bacterium]
MDAVNRIAFKEWAVVCRALADGAQSIILRKGGIDEGSEGFRVRHREFWLFPTQFHQRSEQLVPEAGPLLERVRAEGPPAGTIAIGQYVVVDDVCEINDESLLGRLAGFHIWSRETIVQRFQYRQPGLFLLLARVYRVPQPFLLSDTPYFAGCRSWIELPEALPTTGAIPVLSDEQFAGVRERVREALAGG